MSSSFRLIELKDCGPPKEQEKPQSIEITCTADTISIESIITRTGICTLFIITSCVFMAVLYMDICGWFAFIIVCKERDKERSYS